jgi:hypothetical protein
MTWHRACSPALRLYPPVPLTAAVPLSKQPGIPLPVTQFNLHCTAQSTLPDLPAPLRPASQVGLNQVCSIAPHPLNCASLPCPVKDLYPSPALPMTQLPLPCPATSGRPRVCRRPPGHPLWASVPDCVGHRAACVRAGRDDRAHPRGAAGHDGAAKHAG